MFSQNTKNSPKLSQSDKFLIRKLSYRYIVALSLITILVTTAWVTLDNVVSEGKNHALIINMSGRQRMLSQTIALQSFRLLDSPFEQRPEIRSTLRKSVNLMLNSHLDLTTNANIKIYDGMSDKVRSMYFAPPLAIDAQLKSYLSIIEDILDTPDEALQSKTTTLKNSIVLSADNLLQLLDIVVTQYQLESENAIHRIQKTEMLIWIASILLLLIEALFIFSPTILQIKKFIIESNEAELKLVAARKEAESANKLKSQFLSTMSHELRTPLTSIKGTLGLLSNDVVKDQEQVKELLTMANKNSARLENLINDIIDIDKLQRKGIEYYDKQLDVVHLVENLIKMEDSYAKKYNVKVLFDKSKYEEIFLYVDPHRIEQVISNLISNAIKFSPRGDQILIELSCIDNRFRFSVTDNGKGVDENFRSKIFDHFTQADASDTREKGGTGLGLAIAKEIIDHYSGVIDYICGPDGGTCFYFELDLRATSKH